MILRQMLNPPNWFTSASLFCGLYAILLAGEADGDASLFYKAGLMIFFAGLFDMLDGRVARLTGTGSAFGVQLDSLVDIISFGVAPACLVYFWGLQDLGAFGVFVSGLLMLAGAFRLARFNVTAGDGKAHKWSQGLTITMGGGTVSSLVMWHAGDGVGAAERPETLIGFVLMVAFLEVSNVPYRTLKGLRLRPATVAGLVIFGGICLAIGAMYDISAVLVLLGVTHVLSGPIEAIVFWPRRRRERKARRAADASAPRPPEE